MVALTLIGFGMLIYLYGGYLLCLKLLKHFGQKPAEDAAEIVELPNCTVLITVFNEENKIEERVSNVLACAYPQDKLEVMVASDGSTDGTDELVQAISDDRVRLFRPAERKGKTDTQNQAIASAKGEIIIFTDADTRFDPAFLQEMARAFMDSRVGGVDGHLLFVTDAADGVSQSQGFYWQQELQIRQLESQLGILAVASGACMAIRRKLFRPMQATVGEDCLVPLDVVNQGFRMAHASKALAFDRMEHDPDKEFRTRVRMTLRNWQGTWSYSQLLNPLRHPGVAFSLWSHKVLRWLSPVFLTLWLGASWMLLIDGSVKQLLGVPGLFFLSAAIVGAMKLPLPGASVAYSFCLANAGFLVGVVKALSGKTMTTYK